MTGTTKTCKETSQTHDARDGALAGWQCGSTHGNHKRPPNNRTADNHKKPTMVHHHTNDQEPNPQENTNNALQPRSLSIAHMKER